MSAGGYDYNPIGAEGHGQPYNEPSREPYVDTSRQSMADSNYKPYNPNRQSYVDTHGQSYNAGGTADGPAPHSHLSGATSSGTPPPLYGHTPEPQAPKDPAVLGLNDLGGGRATPNEDGFLLNEKEKKFFRLPAKYRKDQPKPVCTTNRFSAITTFILYHLPALACTGVLLALYITNTNWKSANISSERLSALQFAAKVHEAMILMSLTDILLHRIRYALLGDNGVPLGFLSSAFHLYAPILYLFSWEFWSTAFHKTRNPKFHRLTSILIVLFILVGIAVGPFSAVAMIPRLQWLKTPDQESMYNRTDFAGPQTPYILKSPYVMELDETSVPTSRGRKIMSYRENRNVTLLVTQAITTINTVPLDGSFAQFNLTVAADGTMTPYRPLTMSLHLRGDIKLSYASAPMGFLSDALSRTMAGGSGTLGAKHEYMIRAQSKNSSSIPKWKNPLVTSRCAEALHDPAQPNLLGFSWGDDLFQKNVTLDFNGPLKVLAGYQENAAFSAPQAFVLDTQAMQDQVGLALSGAILFTNHIAQEDQAKAGTDLFVNLCLIQARWVDAESWVDTSHPVAVQSELTIPDSRILDYFKRTSDDESLVKLKPDFLTNIGPTKNSTDGTLETNVDLTDILQHSMNMYRATWGKPGALIISELMSAYIADAMSFTTRLMDYKPSQASTDPATSSPPPESALLIDRTIYWYLYVYTFRDSTAIPVAFAILLMHAIIVTCHFALILFSLKPWHSHGWEDFGEFIALALRSRASNLANVGGGATSSETWRKSITVREVEGDGHLEMVVDDPRMSHAGLLQGQPALKKVVPGQKYS